MYKKDDNRFPFFFFLISFHPIKQFDNAHECYEKVLKDIPTHARCLRQLAWLSFNRNKENQDTAISYLLRSLETGK